INIKDIKLDINLAIPCGLIINELVSNSLKYAFPEGRKGELIISFTYENQTYILTVKDNGIGISEKNNLKEPQTLGLLLVNSLIAQLRGTLELEKIQGTCFKITFKKTELKTYGKV
ncbi:MAG: sensor histidine kinase, partial [Candidatus Cloacimonetes bacterium]|nr:sensor histidine kinase [Candidatus Cloacimonadota bacterium]